MSTEREGASDDIRNALQIIVGLEALRCPCCDCTAELTGVKDRLVSALKKIERPDWPSSLRTA